MIETYLDQITKTLYSQKELLLSFVKIQNNVHINKFAEQYQNELKKLKAVNEEFHSKRNENFNLLEANSAATSSDENNFNQLKSQIAIIKSELTYLKSQNVFEESIEQLKERIGSLENYYSTFKKNQEFCSDFQFNDFLTVYNSTMKNTTESIKIHHEDILKLKAVTNHLQQKQASDRVLHSIRCLKHEIKKMKKNNDQTVENPDLFTNIQANIANCKTEIESMQIQMKKLSEIEKNLNNLLNSQKSDNIIQPKYEQSSSPNNSINQLQDHPLKDKQSQMETSYEIKTEIEKPNGHKITFDGTISKLKSEFDKQRDDIKIIKTSIGCIKHEMRLLKIQFEDNILISQRVDTLVDKYKKIKDKLKLENSSPGSPKKNGASYDDDSIQKIREDLQMLKQNFVETFSMQNSSITSQSKQIKELRKFIDDVNVKKVEKNINDRLKVIETKLQIITTLASA